VEFAAGVTFPETPMVTAKVFETGRSQAIRLPKEFRVQGREVHLKRVPEGFIVMTRDPWDVFREGVAELPESFIEAGRRQPALEKRRPLR
jgi:antitoxin VapB